VRLYADSHRHLLLGRWRGVGLLIGRGWRGLRWIGRRRRILGHVARWGCAGGRILRGRVALRRCAGRRRILRRLVLRHWILRWIHDDDSLSAIALAQSTENDVHGQMTCLTLSVSCYSTARMLSMQVWRTRYSYVKGRHAAGLLESAAGDHEPASSGCQSCATLFSASCAVDVPARAGWMSLSKVVKSVPVLGTTGRALAVASSA
jgi:hypothetical protein